MNFISDNIAGASPKVMAAIAAANDGPASAYGTDGWTQATERRIAEIFEHEVAVFLVTSGTAANALALASLTRPWGAVITHEESHVADDECGAPEFFSDGAKLIGLPGAGNKLSPADVTQTLARFREGALHQVQPQALSITQATECGTIYTPDEIRALKAAAAPRSLALHMDGDRFANAPEHTVGFWTRYQFPDLGLALALGGDYVDVRRSLSNQKVRPYLVLDASIIYTRGPWRALVRIDNLTDEVYAASGFIDRTGHFPGAPRSVFLELSRQW